MAIIDGNEYSTSGSKSVIALLRDIKMTFQPKVVAVGFFIRDLATAPGSSSPFIIKALNGATETEFSFAIDVSNTYLNNWGVMYFGIIDFDGIDTIILLSPGGEYIYLDQISAFTLSDVK
jgi:hypothetical protein